MESKHTPGPWSVVDQNFIKDATGKVITSLACDTRLSIDAVRANTKLLAAAPELLKENDENHIFLSWLAQEVSAGRIDLWSDKKQWVYERLASTAKAIKKATE